MAESTDEERWRIQHGWLVSQDALARIGRDADRLAEYERHAILREEWMPEYADRWFKKDDGQCVFVSAPFESLNGRSAVTKEAPDLRPDEDGPITLTIIG